MRHSKQPMQTTAGTSTCTLPQCCRTSTLNLQRSLPGHTCWNSTIIPNRSVGPPPPTCQTHPQPALPRVTTTTSAWEVLFGPSCHLPQPDAMSNFTTNRCSATHGTTKHKMVSMWVLHFPTSSIQNSHNQQCSEIPSTQLTDS